MSDGLMQINQSLSATATAAATASSASSSAAAAASPPLCDGLEHLRQPTCYPLEAAMLLRVVMTSCTALTLAATLLSLVLVLKYRHHKLMRAASPSLLTSMLTGCLILNTESIVVVFSVNDVMCMLRPWFRHLGFCVMYGALIFKTWRVAVIMNTVKLRPQPTCDAHLYRRMALLAGVYAIYLTVWSSVQPVPVLCTHAQRQCGVQWWGLLALAGELGLVSWGGLLCHNARRAPRIYNDSWPVSLLMWQEALWIVCYSTAVITLERNPDPEMWMAIHFLRAQVVVASTLLLLLVPKFYHIVSNVRELHGVLTDVDEGKRVHRFSLMVNRRGEVRTLYCVPCGPLTYLEQTPQPHSDSDTPPLPTTETQYTQVEVDKLITMVTSLKREKELYRLQARHLASSLLNVRHGPQLNGHMISELSHVMDPPGKGQGHCQGHNQTGVSHSRKASTVTTFLPSSSEDSCDDESPRDHSPQDNGIHDNSSGISEDGDVVQDLPSKHEALSQCCFDVGPASLSQHRNNIGTTPRGSWVAAQNREIPSGHCSTCLANISVINPSEFVTPGMTPSVNTSLRSRANSRCLASPATEDFPLLVRSADSDDVTHRHAAADHARPLVPASSTKMAAGQRRRGKADRNANEVQELQDLTAIIDTSAKPGQGKRPRPHSGQHVNFVMYI